MTAPPLDAEMASSILAWKNATMATSMTAICVEMIAHEHGVATVFCNPMKKNAIMVNSMVEMADAAKHAFGHSIAPLAGYAYLAMMRKSTSPEAMSVSPTEYF